MTDSTYEVTAEASRNTLSIQNLERHHFGKTFSCLAVNNNATEPVATNVTVDMRREYLFLLLESARSASYSEF